MTHPFKSLEQLSRGDIGLANECKDNIDVLRHRVTDMRRLILMLIEAGGGVMHVSKHVAERCNYHGERAELERSEDAETGDVVFRVRFPDL
jgi:hypothetical protein